MFFNENYYAELENAYIEAKLGNQDSEFRLLTLLEGASKSLMMSYKKSLNKFGINQYDLEGVLVETFESLYFNDDELVYNTPNYFKYLYIQKVKTLIRNRAKKLEKEAGKQNEYVLNLIESENYSSSSDETFLPDNELCDLVLNDDKTRLTKREKEVLSLYLDDYKIKEISEKLNICYSVSFRALKSALNKSKDYLIRNNLVNY